MFQESLGLDSNILRQSLESISARLDNRDGYMAGFARINVSHHTGFTPMSAANDFAFGAIPKIPWYFGFRSIGVCLTRTS